MGCLYKLDFKSGKSYIGITKHSVKRRMAGHRWAAAKRPTALIYHAWKKHGEPTVTVLAYVSEERMAHFERRAIRAYKTICPSGYNLTEGGETNKGCLPEIREKLSAARKGKKWSPELRAKMKIAMKGNNAGKVRSVETKAAMSAVAKRRVFSPETLTKMANSRRGRKHSPETLKKMSQWQKGVKKTPEFIAKLKGRLFSAEHRENISKSRRGIT